jgi:hypothetical protein
LAPLNRRATLVKTPFRIWEPFGYRKLYDRARLAGLSEPDRKLFAATPNFERVLADLLAAIRVSDAVGLETKPLLEHYRNIQLALVHAVREVHLKLNRVKASGRDPLSGLRNLAGIDDLAGAIQDPNLAATFLPGQLSRGLDRICLRGTVRSRTSMALLDHVPASPAGGLLYVARIFHPGLHLASFLR